MKKSCRTSTGPTSHVPDLHRNKSGLNGKTTQTICLRPQWILHAAFLAGLLWLRAVPAQANRPTASRRRPGWSLGGRPIRLRLIWSGRIPAPGLAHPPTRTG